VNRREALVKIRQILIQNNIEEAALESDILLCHTLGIDRIQLYREPERELIAEEDAALWQLVSRRIKGEPTAYITAHREFFGLDFLVTPAVLIPRPETELLVERALELARSNALNTLADIGTGCGAIAISLAKNLTGAGIYATDISDDALKVARINCQRHGVTDRIVLLRGDLLEPLPEPVDLIVANLPYVRKSDIPGQGPLSFEPRAALDGGEEGLDKIKALAAQLNGKLKPGGWLLLEIGQGQAKAVVDLLTKRFPTAHVEVARDLAGIERVVCFCLTAS
jgi:release factor glutamine methyltransferase